MKYKNVCLCIWNGSVCGMGYGFGVWECVYVCVWVMCVVGGWVGGWVHACVNYRYHWEKWSLWCGVEEMGYGQFVMKYVCMQ